MILWALCQADLLVSYWQTALHCGFFIIMQPMKTAGDIQGPGGLIESPISLRFCPECLHYIVRIASRDCKYSLVIYQMVSDKFAKML
jgi:hypothetical protein